ncbi:MAG TPA: hypothetical protein VGJ84_12715, partial [Polyangiaceae bacterium]
MRAPSVDLKESHRHVRCAQRSWFCAFSALAMNLIALVCPSRSHAQAALDRPFSPGFALSPI